MDKSISVYGRPWPDPVRGPWLIRLRFALVDGMRECVGMEIRSVRVSGESAASRVPHNPTRLTGAVLREVPLGALIDEWRKLAGLMLRSEALRLEGKARKAALATSGQWLETSIRRGRPSKGIEFYADVAKVYREALSAGESPILAVRQWHRRQTGAADYPTKSAAAKWVHRARGLHLLPPVRGQESEVTQ